MLPAFMSAQFLPVWKNILAYITSELISDNVLEKRLIRVTVIKSWEGGDGDADIQQRLGGGGASHHSLNRPLPPEAEPPTRPARGRALLQHTVLPGMFLVIINGDAATNAIAQTRTLVTTRFGYCGCR